MIAALTLCASSFAFEIEPVGMIADELFAPTSIDVSNDQIAVLEPFKRQITLFTPDGRINCKVDISGDASGLKRLSEHIYLFCDRADRKVNAVNIISGQQYVFLGNEAALVNPIDIEFEDSKYFVLDADRREIVVINSNFQVQSRIVLVQPDSGLIGFPSSFAYNSNLQRFYIFDQINSKVWIVSLQGEFLDSFCSFGGAGGEITRGGEIACDVFGNVYVTDRYQGRIAVFSSNGNFITNIELTEPGRAGFAVPTGIAIDSQQFLYVSSTEGKLVKIFHLNDAGSPNISLDAFQVFPEIDDTVDVSEIVFVAFTDYSPEDERTSTKGNGN